MTSNISKAGHLQLLGQRWKFLDEKSSKGHGNQRHNDSVMREIEVLESKSINERLLELHENELSKIMKAQASIRPDSPVVHNRLEWKPSQMIASGISRNDGTRSPSTNVKKELIDTQDARELAVSLNTIRIFYAQQGRDMDQTFKQNIVVDKVQDSPRTKDKVIRKPENNLIYKNGTITEDKGFRPKAPETAPIIIPNHGPLTIRPPVNYSGSFNNSYTPTSTSSGVVSVGSTPMSRRAAANRKNKLRQSWQYNFNDGDYNKVNVEQAARSHTIAKAMMRSRAGITRSNAEKTRLRLAAAQEQVMGIEISKHFRRYTVDKGLRVPVCLQQLPTPPQTQTRAHTVAVGGHSRPGRTTTLIPSSGNVSRVASQDDGDSAANHSGTGVQGKALSPERPMTTSRATFTNSPRLAPILTSRSTATAATPPNRHRTIHPFAASSTD